MEKLVYLLLASDGAAEPGLAGELRERTVPALRSLGAHTIQVNVTDAELGHPFGVAPDQGSQQILAAVSVWVDTAEGSRVGGALPDPGVGALPDPGVGALPDPGHRGPGGAAWHGWLVCESEPMPNRTVPPGTDGHVPGFAQIVALTRPAHLAWGEWRRIWQGAHTSVAVNTQSTFRYVQNVVFRPLTAGAPSYAAIVEECFPIGAATDLHVFFDAVGDDAKLSRHMAAMSESCDRFMDGADPVAWTREWIF